VRLLPTFYQSRGSGWRFGIPKGRMPYARTETRTWFDAPLAHRALTKRQCAE